MEYKGFKYEFPPDFKKDLLDIWGLNTEKEMEKSIDNYILWNEPKRCALELLVTLVKVDNDNNVGLSFEKVIH